MRASVALLLALPSALVGLGHVRAQDRTVIRDEWTATWTDGRKSSWSHVVIEHAPAAADAGFAYVVSACRVAVVDGDARATWSRWTATDADGRVLAARAVEDAPWGRTAQEVATIGTSLRWRRQVRDLPPEEDTIPATAYAEEVVTLRLQASTAAEVTTERLTFNGPLTIDRATHRFDVARAPDGTTTVRIDGEIDEVRSSAGHRLPRARDPRRCVGPTTPERAADLDEPAPTVDGLEPTALADTPGVRLRVPGPEWIVVTKGREELRLGAIDLVHPSMTWSSVLIEDGRMFGSTTDERLRFVRAIRRRFGEAALADPVPCTFQGREGFSFPVRLVVRGVELTGELAIVDVGTARATVWVVQPTDLQARRPDDLRRALDALELVDVERTWQRVSLPTLSAGALSAEVPGHWTETSFGQHGFWSLGSWVRLCREPLAGRTLEEVAEGVLASGRQPEARRVDEQRTISDLSGRMALTVIEESAAMMPDGMTLTLHVGVCVADVGDGLGEAVVLLGFGNEMSPEEIRRILASVRWSR